MAWALIQIILKLFVNRINFNSTKLQSEGCAWHFNVWALFLPAHKNSAFSMSSSCGVTPCCFLLLYVSTFWRKDEGLLPHVLSKPTWEAQQNKPGSFPTADNKTLFGCGSFPDNSKMQRTILELELFVFLVIRPEFYMWFNPDTATMDHAKKPCILPHSPLGSWKN